MPKKRTIRERIIAGLETRGEKLVKRTAKSDVYTCTPFNCFYYVGKINSLRRGPNKVSSIALPGLTAAILKEQI